jgi:site-specific DNA-methyltransferase (adenine-specific)
MDLPINQIICGDCLEVMKTFPDKSIDLVLTDPPYGTDFDYYSKGRGAGLAKSTDYGNQDWNKEKLNCEYFSQIFRISKNQIIFGGNYYGSVLGDTSCYIVWDKDNNENNFADCELAWTSFKSAVRKFKWRWNGMLQEDMKHKEPRYHPTQKPVELMKWILDKYSQPTDLILDPFLGSGTTIIAAKQLHRRYIGIEISQKYCDVAKSRLGQEVLF